MKFSAFAGPSRKLPFRRKNLADLFYANRVTANFVPNFVAMATGVGGRKCNCDSNFIIPKKHILARDHVVWAIARKNPPKGLTCRWVSEKSIWIAIKFFAYISPICREAPLVQIYMKFCVRSHLADVINRAKFFLNRIRGFNSVGGRIFGFPIRKRSRR